MRILFTGGTSRQAKPPSRRGRSIDKIDVPFHIVESLRRGGHHIDWSPVRPGQDLSEYDVIWLGWANWLSRNSPNTLGAMWAFGFDVPKVVFLDDWSWHMGLSHLRTICKNPDKYLSRPDYYSGCAKLTDQEVRDGARLVAETAPLMADPTNWESMRVNQVVVPMYGFGNPQIVNAAKDWNGWNPNVRMLDPSSAIMKHRRLHPQQPSVKHDRWALASLSDQSSWVNKQGLTWPVQYYGCRKLKAPRLSSEADVLHEYSLSQGVLQPPYGRLKGAHWFRSRYLYAALGDSFLWADPADRLVPYEDQYIETDGRYRRMIASDQREIVLDRIFRTWQFDAACTTITDDAYLG